AESGLARMPVETAGAPEVMRGRRRGSRLWRSAGLRPLRREAMGKGTKELPMYSDFLVVILRGRRVWISDSSRPTARRFPPLASQDLMAGAEGAICLAAP